MKRITFISQIKNIEFASRWRRELASLDVEEGRKLSKQIKQSYSFSDKSPVPGKVLSPKDREQNRLGETIYKEKAKAAQKRQSLKIDKTPIEIDNHSKNIYDPRRFAHSKPDEKIKLGGKLGKERLEQLRQKYGRNKSLLGTPTAPTSSPDFKPPSAKDFDFTGLHNEPKWDKIKLKKAGLAGAGLLTAGAIGYGIYRKMRSDKGKKRGNYHK